MSREPTICAGLSPTAGLEIPPKLASNSQISFAKVLVGLVATAPHPPHLCMFFLAKSVFLHLGFPQSPHLCNVLQSKFHLHYCLPLPSNFILWTYFIPAALYFLLCLLILSLLIYLFYCLVYSTVISLVFFSRPDVWSVFIYFYISVHLPFSICLHIFYLPLYNIYSFIHFDRSLVPSCRPLSDARSNSVFHLNCRPIGSLANLF